MLEYLLHSLENLLSNIINLGEECWLPTEFLVLPQLIKLWVLLLRIQLLNELVDAHYEFMMLITFRVRCVMMTFIR